jgi:hypothetical protein
MFLNDPNRPKVGLGGSCVRRLVTQLIIFRKKYLHIECIFFNLSFSPVSI